MKRFSNSGKFGIVILSINIIFAICSIFIDPQLYRVPCCEPLLAPNFKNFLGSDDLGMDIFFQIIHGSLISLTIGFFSAFLSGLGGSILGILAGYKGRIYDKIIGALCDIITTLPQLPLIIVLSVFLGPSTKTIILVVSLLSWVGPAKMIRAKVKMLKNESYIVAAKSYGANFFYLVFNHFIFQILPMVLVSTFRIASHAIISEASLSFLGLGDPTSKSWGIILNHAMSFQGIYFTEYWKWWILSPLVMLILLILSLSFISRDIEKLMNKKL